MVIGTIEIETEQEIGKSFFDDPERTRYDEQWRAKHTNKHRPSACGGLGKALAKYRRPSFGDGIKNFRKIQRQRTPSIQAPSLESDVLHKSNQQKLYSQDYIDPQGDLYLDDIYLEIGDNGDIVYATKLTPQDLD